MKWQTKEDLKSLGWSLLGAFLFAIVVLQDWIVETVHRCVFM